MEDEREREERALGRVERKRVHGSSFIFSNL